MAATIHDVARLAGVAISTVSKVMSDSGRISEQTRTRVRDAMQQLDYHPSRHARGLARNCSDTIGVLMPLQRNSAFANPYVFEILCGIERYCASQHYSVLLLDADALQQEPKSVARLVAERKVDGVILHADDKAPALLRQFSEHDLPHLVIGRQPGPHSWVDIDNRHAGQLATQHLLQQGYSRLQFIGNHAADTISADRLGGFAQTLAEQGLAPHAPALFATGGQYGEAAALWQQLRQQPTLPDALLVAGNPLAAGLLAAAQHDGLNIGPALGIASFDNYPYAEQTQPPLSVVDIDLFALGEQAARELFLQLAKPSRLVQSLLLEMQLFARPSSQR